MTTTAKIAATAYSTLEKTNQGSWWVRTSFTANTDAGITGKDMVTYRNSMWKRFNDAGGQVMGFTRCSYGDWQNVIRFSVRYRVDNDAAEAVHIKNLHGHYASYTTPKGQHRIDLRKLVATTTSPEALTMRAEKVAKSIETRIAKLAA